jgi:hypothetical protein
MGNEEERFSSNVRERSLMGGLAPFSRTVACVLPSRTCKADYIVGRQYTPENCPFASPRTQGGKFLTFQTMRLRTKAASLSCSVPDLV